MNNDLGILSPSGGENMLQLETALSREDAQDFADWILSEIATRVASKHQKAPIVARHIARRTAPKYVRGSDLSERLHASFEMLKGAGYTHKHALLVVAERAQKYLGKSSRGRPRLGDSRRDFLSTVQSVRSMINAFARRTRDTEGVVRFWVDQFLWGRAIGAIRGSEFDSDFGKTMYEARLAALHKLGLRGFVWPTRLSHSLR